MMVPVTASSDTSAPFAPVDLGLRFVAGLIDLIVLGVVGVVLALGPLWLGGLALPMVGAVAAVLVCQVLPLSAFELHRAWPGSELKVVGDAGHALSEPGIASELVKATDAARSRAIAAE